MRRSAPLRLVERHWLYWQWHHPRIEHMLRIGIGFMRMIPFISPLDHQKR